MVDSTSTITLNSLSRPFAQRQIRINKQKRLNSLKTILSSRYSTERYEEHITAIHNALKQLGLTQHIILPTSSIPAIDGRYSDKEIIEPDLAIGSNRPIPEILDRFFSLFGVKGIIDNPTSYLTKEGLQNGTRVCPYAGNGALLPVHNIDFFSLTKEGQLPQLLQLRTLESIASQNTEPGSSNINYQFIGSVLPQLEAEIYSTFQNLNTESMLGESLLEDLKAHKAENEEVIKASFIAEHIAQKEEYKDSYFDFSKFSSDDKAIFLSQESMEKYIKDNNLKDKYEKFMLMQFIAYKQIQHRNAIDAELGYKRTGDVPIGLPQVYFLLHPEAELKGQAQGAPYEEKFQTAQSWDYTVLHPGKYFNPDGSLGISGKILKKYIKFLALIHGGQIRFDHAIAPLGGLWVYPRDASDGAANSQAVRLRTAPPGHALHEFSLISDAEAFDLEKLPYHPDFIKPEFVTDEVLAKSTKIFTNIIIPTVEEAAKELEVEAKIVLETLGVKTEITRKSYEKLKQLYPEIISDMRVMQHAELAEIREGLHESLPTSPNGPLDGDYLFLSTHDSPRISKYVENLFKEEKQEAWLSYLQCVIPEMDREKAKTDPKYFELCLRAASLRGKDNVRVNYGMFFSDCTGLTLSDGQQEDYNKPGTGAVTTIDSETNIPTITPDPNWKHRIPRDFVDKLSQALISGEMVSFPEALIMALKAKFGQRIDQFQELLNQLSAFDKELKTPDSPQTI